MTRRGRPFHGCSSAPRLDPSGPQVDMSRRLNAAPPTAGPVAREEVATALACASYPRSTAVLRVPLSSPLPARSTSYCANAANGLPYQPGHRRWQIRSHVRAGRDRRTARHGVAPARPCNWVILPMLVFGAEVVDRDPGISRTACLEICGLNWRKYAMCSSPSPSNTLRLAQTVNSCCRKNWSSGRANVKPSMARSSSTNAWSLSESAEEVLAVAAVGVGSRRLRDVWLSGTLLSAEHETCARLTIAPTRQTETRAGDLALDIAAQLAGSGSHSSTSCRVVRRPICWMPDHEPLSAMW